MPSLASASRLLVVTVLLSVLAVSGGPAAAQSWLDADWAWRTPFEVVADSIPSGASLQDFSILVSLRGADHPQVFSHAKADGSDLVFTAADGTTVLDREVVSFDSIGQQAEVWVRADELSQTANSFFLYYGNADTTISTPPSSAWKSSYRAVFHFADDPGAGVLSDSSPRQGDVTLTGDAMWTSSDTTSAQVHQGWMFNGTTHMVSSRSISTPDSSYVIGAWVMNTTEDTDFFVQASPGFWHTSSVTGGASSHPDYARVGAQVSWFPEQVPLNDGYHHFAWVFDGVNDTMLFYFDGQPQDVRHTYPSGLAPFYTGSPLNPDESTPVGILGPMYTSPGDFMTGGGDEFRVHEGILSAEWLLTEYRNQRDPHGFLSFGAEEPVDVTATGPTLADTRLYLRSRPNPFRGRTSVSFAMPTEGHTRLTVYDLAGRLVRRLVDAPRQAGAHVVHWDGRNREGVKAAQGVYFLRLETPAGRTSTKVLRLQ